MESTEESSTPRFATAVRGYDRMQVDDYVERLHQWVDQADHRAQQCEAASARATEEAEQLRRRLSSADADALTNFPVGDSFAQSVDEKYEVIQATPNNVWKGIRIKHPAIWPAQ